MTPSNSVLQDYKLTLYHQYPTRSTRVQWLIYELGIEDNITTKYIQLHKGEHKTEEFKKLTPLALVPACVIEDVRTGNVFTMMESGAICTFLTDLAASPLALKPAADNVFGTAQYHRLVTMATATVDPLLSAIRLNETALPPHEQVPETARRARKQFGADIVPALEAVLLDGSVWACHPYHEGFTTADVMLGYCLFFASVLKLLDGSVTLQKYLGRVMEREAFKKVMRSPNPLPL